MCDDSKDCRDGSDERNCTNAQVRAALAGSRASKYHRLLRENAFLAVLNGHVRWFVGLFRPFLFGKNI